MEAINETRLEVWKEQPEEFFEEAILEADGTLAPTTGECKGGMNQYCSALCLFNGET